MLYFCNTATTWLDVACKYNAKHVNTTKNEGKNRLVQFHVENTAEDNMAPLVTLSYFYHNSLTLIHRSMHLSNYIALSTA